MLKNGAIRSVSKKRSKQLMELIDLSLEQNEGIIDDGNSFIIGVLKDFISVVEAQGGSFNIRQDEITNWFDLLVIIVIQAVRVELSYDPTIGSNEDFELIEKIVREELKKWRGRVEKSIDSYSSAIDSIPSPKQGKSSCGYNVTTNPQDVSKENRGIKMCPSCGVYQNASKEECPNCGHAIGKDVEIIALGMGANKLQKPMQFLTWSFLLCIISTILFIILSSFLKDEQVATSENTMFIILVLNAVIMCLTSVFFYICIGVLASRLNRSGIVWIGLTFIFVPFGPFVAYFRMRNLVNEASP